MLGEIIRYGSILFTLLPIIIFLRLRDTIRINAFGYLNVAIIISFFTDIALAFLAELKIPNLIIGNGYVTLLFVIIILFYKNILPEKIEWLYVFIVLYFGFELINTVLFQGINEYQGYSRAFGGILLITCSLMYFNSLLVKLPTTNVMRYGLFWVNAGILYYYSFNLLLFIYTNYVFTNLSSEIGMVFWSFHNVNNIIKNILFCVGIYYASKT